MTSNSNTRISDTQLEKLVASCLDDFFKRRLQVLRAFSLGEVLRGCNAYSLALEGNHNASKMVEELMKVHVRASDETTFGKITGDPGFYLKLLRLMKDEPSAHRAEYLSAWAAAVNRFTAEFVRDYCLPDGSIDWEKLVRHVSEASNSKTNP